MKTAMTFKATSLYVALYHILVIFMFKNSDMYFNINNYKTILILLDLYGAFIVIASNREAKVRVSSWGWIALSICSLLLSKYIIQKPAAPYYVLYIIFLLIFLMNISLIQFNREQVVHIIDGYILSSVIMSAMLIVTHRTPYASYGILRYALYYNSERFYDVNFNAIYLLLPTLISFYVFLKVKRRKRWLYFAVSLLNSVAILLLGSRGAFVPCFSIMVFYLLKERGVALWKIIFVIVAILSLKYIVPKDVYSRLLGTSYLGTESKRYIDWSYGFRAIRAEWLFGNGMQAPIDIVAKYGGRGVITYTIHNTYLVYLAQLGIVLSIPFFAILIVPIIKLSKIKQNAYLTACYFGFLFSILMVESNYTYVFFIPVSIFYMLIKHCQDYKISNTDILLLLFDKSSLSEKA